MLATSIEGYLTQHKRLLILIKGNGMGPGEMGGFERQHAWSERYIYFMGQRI